jgi:very-short-patch-repair endonuclease
MNERPPDSVLEEAMTRLVMRFSLPQLVFHPRLVGYEVDFLVAGSCIVVECDGWATHGLMRSTFESDRVRDNDLAAAGYVVRFTWRQICRQPASVARRLRAVIARHEPDLLIRRRALGTAGA